jgi:Resolvase, N terminal domain
MADANRHQFDAVIVWKFDRFARSVSHLLRALETFQALGIDFVSLSESLDTSTPAGKMVFTVRGAVAELERTEWKGRFLAIAYFLPALCHSKVSCSSTKGVRPPAYGLDFLSTSKR